ncbi:TonB-dependent receptor domain-containing protein [Pseudomonadota bacterium]
MYQFAKKVALPLVIAYLCINPQVFADSPTVIVTATRTPQSIDNTIAPVSTITRTEIEQSGAKSVTELLTGMPGIDTSTNGGYGQPSSIFLRGTNSNHVLTLVDGVRVGSATVGTTAFHLIPVDQIDRVEILRGPRASLYGSDAIGGVIQIFTRQGSKETQTNAKLGYGTHNTVNASAGISGSFGKSSGSVNVSRISTDGINAQDAGNPDDDGYENNSLSANLNTKFSDTAGLNISVLRASGENEFDNAFDPPTDEHSSEFVQQVLSVRGHFMPTAIWDSSIRFGDSRDDLDTFKNKVKDGVFDTKRQELSWQNDLQLGAALVTLGLDYVDESVSGSTDYVVSERDNTGLFGQWQQDFSAHHFVVGARHDDNEQFGSHNTGNLDYGYDLNSDLLLSFAYGTAFKAPSFNDLYFPGFGNPDLKPEESTSYELGLRGKQQWGNWAVRAYHTEIDELIVFDLVKFVPENIANATIKGLEFEGKTKIGEWGIFGALNLIDPRNSDTDKTLRRRARETLRLDANRKISKGFVQIGLIQQGKRYEDAANTVELDGYVLLNMKAGYELGKQWQLEAALDNALDEDYQTADGFNTLGRTIMLTLKFMNKADGK